MALPLPKYRSIKNKYCIGYFGNKSSYLIQLEKSIPYIQKEFPELNIYIACKDKDKEIINNQEVVILYSELQKKINNIEFAYYREINDGGCNPVKFLLDESDIPYPEELFAN